MTPKLVISLALFAGITSVTAVVAYRSNNVFVPVAGVGEKVLAGLEEKINNAREIIVEQGVDKIHLVFKNDAWQVKQSGYPVSPEKVRTALVGLVNLSKLEAKTANKKKYLLIGVDGPGEEKGRGRQFTLRDKNNKKIGSIVVGKVLAGKAGPGRDAQYVRVAKDKTSWLALGSVLATPALPTWVEPRFLKIEVNDVLSARLEHSDGEIVEVERTGKDEIGSSRFKMLNVPEGRKTRTSTTIKFVATDLVNLDLIDVRRKKTNAKAVSTALVEINGGLKIKFKFVEEPNPAGGKPHGWVSFDVVEKGSDTTKASAIAARTNGWEYLVADYKAQAFRKRNEQLLLKPKAAN